MVFSLAASERCDLDWNDFSRECGGGGVFKKLAIIFMALIAMNATAKNQVAIFAGGCFWCLQADFDKLKGVVSTTAGYDGGHQANPSYELVSSGRTQYAESVKVVFDSQKLTYSDLLNYFWRHIDPTAKNKQFCDKGYQYRSAIFYLNASQKAEALASKKALSDRFKQVYTEVVPSTHFYPAEKYHQDYYQKNPIRYRYYRWNCGRDKRLKEVWGEH